MVPVNASELMKLLADHDGPLTVPQPRTGERAQWRRVIWAALHDNASPAGFRLRHRGRDAGDLVIWLEEITDAPPVVAPQQIPVPARLRNPQPLIAAAKAAA